MNWIPFILYFLVISYLFFGISCLTAPIMKNEFIRYGVPKYRTTVGVLQLLGALGLLLGYFFFVPLAIFSALGLSVLMLFGFGVRLKIRDTFIKSFPSLFYAILNGYIAVVLGIV